MASSDTIFALSSGAVPAGIAIIRVSGPEAGSILHKLAGGMPRARRASYRPLHATNGDLIDRAMLLWMPGPATATGEDLAEFHLHGGRAVVARMTAILSVMSGVRMAEAGEFTRRAFLNGRIDLLEAEALGDLLSAETEGQRRAAIAMGEGLLGQRLDPWRIRILRLAAVVEAGLDFGDEDGATAAATDVALETASLAAEVGEALTSPPVERLKDGIRVVLAGPPNAGKSSLLNRLVGREAAIVSPVAGTTRDIVEVPVTIGGTAFLLSDTAGLRAEGDAVERIGIARAQERIETADLLLWLGDEEPPFHSACLWLFPRSDVRNAEALPVDRVRVSALTGHGVKEVIAWLIVHSERLLPRPDHMLLSRRHRRELEAVYDALRRVGQLHDAVLQADALRQARLAIDRLTGRAGFEDLLDSVFGQFCLGK